MGHMAWGRAWVVLGVLAGGAAALSVAGAQPQAAVVRLALVSQWTIDQHRAAMWAGSAPGGSPELRAALEGGVVDRLVFSWQRGVIQRETLVPKPVRVLVGPEAEALGGRGKFQFLGVRPPTGRDAWTEVAVAPGTGGAADVLVLEVGGELNTLRQVLETLLVGAPDGSLRSLPLARRAVVAGDGVPVLREPFGRPVVVPGAPAMFRGASGVEFLVVRSQIETRVNGDTTTNGLADLAPFAAGEWREGDRVFVRVPAAALRAGVPAIVLGWKDRTFRPDGDRESLRRARLLLPAPR